MTQSIVDSARDESASKNDEVLVDVKDLKVHFPVGAGMKFWNENKAVKAVDGVSFEIKRGETLGLVGESGCGKSTLGRALLRLLPATSGDVRFKGTSITNANRRELQDFRRKAQIIFQDPYGSLDPRQKVGDIVGEPLLVHNLTKTKREYRLRVAELFELVGLNPSNSSRYPHEFSGGQRQRIGIARALAMTPEFIVCDEPVSALDVSIQAQIINLLEKLQDELNLTYLFIAHDLSVVRHISDRIAVMYLGNVVEVATPEVLYENPAHPYTQALLSAVPLPDPDLEATRERVPLIGELPSPLNPPTGCVFNTRCPIVVDDCPKISPELRNLTDQHSVACLQSEGYGPYQTTK
jgi:oligopeptide transport system ATP-binding protein